MKSKIYNVLNKPYIVILLMLTSPILGFIDRNLVFFFSLGVALFVFWQSKFDRSKFGFDTKLTWHTFFKSLKYTAVLFLIDYVLIAPILNRFLGEVDLSSFENIKGNFVGYFILMLIMWVFAAFGEEFLNRGFYMKWLAEFMGNKKKSWLLSAVITSLYFAIGHLYQGISGAIGVFLWSLMISFIFIKNRKDLWLSILVHGFFDTIGITLLYFDQMDCITDWVNQMF